MPKLTINSDKRFYTGLGVDNIVENDTKSFLSFLVSRVPTGMMVLFLLLITAPKLWAQETISTTYSQGSIISFVSASITASTRSACPGVLQISVPAGKRVTTVDVAYTLYRSTGRNNFNARSILECSTTGNRETELARAFDIPGTTTTTNGVYYSRTGLAIAEGAAGIVEFELHIFYLNSGDLNLCQDAVGAQNNSWLVTLHLEDDPRWFPDADGDSYVANTPIESNEDLSADGYYLGANLPIRSFDCDDADFDVNPGRVEIPADGKDNDCNSATRDIPSAPKNGDDLCGEVLAFDGVDDYVDTDISITDQSFTLEAWTKLSDLATAEYIFGGGIGSLSNGIYAGYMNSSTIRFSFYGGDLDAVVTDPDTEWHHLAFTFDTENNNTKKIYLDGVELNSQEGSPSYQNSGTLQIGKTTVSYYDGLLDEVKVWNRPLTAREVARSASQFEVADETSALLAYFDFNNQKGSSTLTDNTSNGNDGTLTNMDATEGWVTDQGEETMLLWYPDTDNDGYVGDGEEVTTCSAPGEDYYLASQLEAAGKELGDCDDSEPLIHPGNLEIPGDGIDNDCNPSSRDIPTSPINSDLVCGQVLAFDGVDDYVDTDISITDQSFTLEAWTKLTDASDATFIFGGGIGSVNNGLYAGYLDENMIRFSFYGSGTDLDGEVTNPDTEWHHIAFTFDKENNNTMKIYLDGAELSSKEGSSSYQNSGTLKIGFTTVSYYDGLLDEVKVWNRPLNALELTKSASQLEVGDEASALLAHFDFNNQNGSNTLTDKTSNEYDGTLTNMDATTDWANADGTPAGQLCNEIPEIANIINSVLEANTILSFTVLGSDEETEISYALDATSLSKGMTIGEISGDFSWSPTDEDISTHQVTVTVEDEQGLTASQTFTITVTANNGTNDAPVLSAIGDKTVELTKELTFTATATDTDSETLTFTLDETSTTKGMSIDPSTGGFTWTPGSGQSGSHTVTATVSDGEATDSETITINVIKYDQSITFGAMDAVLYGDAAFELTAKASSGLGVTYSSSDETVATVSENTVTIISPGTTIITASQAGNTDYHPASDVLQDLTVEKASQTISFESLEGKLYGDATFDLTAIATSGLTVSYISSDETVATVSESTVTIIGVGTTTITASQAGNENYNSAQDVAQDLTVGKINQTIILGIEDETVKIYPNPFSKDLTINSSQADMFQVYDQSGRVLIERKLNDGKAELSALEDGVYLLQVKDVVGNILLSTRLIKKAN